MGIPVGKWIMRVSKRNFVVIVLVMGAFFLKPVLAYAGTSPVFWDLSSNGKLIVENGKHYVVTGTWAGTLMEGENVITVPTGVTADITLSGVYIDASTNTCAFALEGNASVVLKLADNTTNTLQSADRAGLGVPTDAMITIEGGGKLNAISGGYGAGIGSDGYTGEAGGEVRISGNADVTADSWIGAGIGGGSSNNRSGTTGGSGGNISISGAAVVTTITRSGAGIGGGSGSTGGTGGNISISDSAVINATLFSISSIGMTGAGIGGGGGYFAIGGDGGNINISDTARVIVKVPFSGAGIGGGGGRSISSAGNGGDIHISGAATVTIFNTGVGAGIGGGGYSRSGSNGGGSGNVSISDDATVTVNSDKGAGIGDGYKSTSTVGSNVFISGGTVTVKSDSAKDIGGSTPGTTTITGGSVFARPDMVDNPTNRNNSIYLVDVTTVDRNGNPVSGATITVGNYSALTGMNDIDFDTNSDSNGKAYIWLPAGDTVITASKTNSGNGSKGLNVSYTNSNEVTIMLNNPPIEKNTFPVQTGDNSNHAVGMTVLIASFCLLIILRKHKDII